MYKYGHILHVPTFGKSVFSFGLTMHSTLQKFFAQNINQGNTQSSLFGSSERPADLSPEARRAKGEALAKAGSGDPPKLEERRGAQLPSLDQLLAFYEESWIDDWYRDKKDKQDHKEKGKKILKDFYDKIKDAIPHVQGLETSFNLRLGNYTIRGRIDRLDKVGDGVELIDYKTGSPKEKLAAEDKEQLLLYQIAAEEVLGQKPTKLTYWYLNDNKPVSFQGSDKDKEKLKIDLLSRIEEIRKSDFKATPGWQCKFCDFREICEYRAD